MLIDSHVHLDAAEFDPDRTDVMAAARRAGVAGFVVPAVELTNFDAVAALSATNADVRHAFGIHPMYVGRAHSDDLDRLDDRLAAGGAIAVGEIGLDHFITDVDRQRQQDFFVAQLRLAKKHDLPVILHLRRAVDAVLKQLRRIEVCGGIAHAFNGSRQQADMLLAMGFKLGFGGTMSFPGSSRIRALASTLPLSAIVLETDAPDIAPAWGQGRRNEPANLARYAEVLAGLRGTSREEIACATGDNLRSVLRWT